ncbi:MAG: ECF transporter S component [Corallococcus sp.]|nr:ECF transporter S component [Corallococcus sp.]MCM1359230.1 ECF transporter S component [Corallococcus sp.]MCM1394621.1 ECF transporter S component [Corallococcus sp.]
MKDVTSKRQKSKNCLAESGKQNFSESERVAAIELVGETSVKKKKSVKCDRDVNLENFTDGEQVVSMENVSDHDDSISGEKDPTSKSTKRQKAKKIAKTSVSYLAKISILSAMAVVLLLIEFPILPATPHLKLNFSDVPSLLASFMFGPITGVIVNGVKVGLGLLIRGTSTGFVGDLSNLVSGSLYALVAGVIYLIKKNKLCAVLALIFSSIVFCIAMWFCNQWFLLPMYGMKEVEVQMPMLWWTLLFNVIKTVLTCIITVFIYKGTHRLFNRF